MKKKDLLLSDFENLKIDSVHRLKGKGDQLDTIETSDFFETCAGCTSGDVGCCDNDPDPKSDVDEPCEDTN